MSNIVATPYPTAGLNMLYPNEFMAIETENQYQSKLNLNQFCIIDNTLVGVQGDTKKIRTYSATDGVQTLAMGEGNTTDIASNYVEREYSIRMKQARTRWYDEETMIDAKAVTTAIDHFSVNFYNDTNAAIYEQLMSGTQEIGVDGTDYFSAFVDAIALFPAEEQDALSLKAIVSSADLAKIRKGLKDSLQYVEAYARSGYIGSVAGVSLYAKNDATAGTIVVTTGKAVTVFNKKGIELEQSRLDPNTRHNAMYMRQYKIEALTDDTQVVRIVLGK